MLTTPCACSLQQLDSQAHQKLEALRHNDPDCYAVVNWLRENKHRFRMEIFEPATLCVTVPNRAYIDAVESCFGLTQLKVRQCVVRVCERGLTGEHRRSSPSAKKTTRC